MTTSANRLLAVVLFAVVVASCTGSSPGPQRTLKVPVGDSPQRGPADAWVTIVEFADFECPYCRAEEPVLADIESTFGADVRLVFKSFPLTGIHPDAMASAIAAQCAADQGRFWELHDLLFRTALDDATLVADAEQVAGLDVAAWQACRGGSTAAARVAADVDLASELGVDGTPTLVVNGVTLIGAIPESELRAAVEQARASAEASGIAKADYYDKAVLGL